MSSSSPSSPQSTTRLKSTSQKYSTATLSSLKKDIHDAINTFAQLTEKYLDDLFMTSSSSSSSSASASTANQKFFNNNHHSTTNSPIPSTQSSSTSTSESTGQNILARLVKVDKSIQIKLLELDQLHDLNNTWKRSQEKNQEFENLFNLIEDKLYAIEDTLQDELYLLKLKYGEEDQLLKNPPTIEEILNYAARIAKTTHPPPLYEPSKMPLQSCYKPPVPQEDMMRASNLFKEQISSESKPSPSLIAAKKMDLSRDSQISQKQSQEPQKKISHPTHFPMSQVGFVDTDWLESDLNPDLS